MTDDRDRLRQLVEAGPPAEAARAATQLIRLIAREDPTALAAEAPRLLQFTRRPDVAARDVVIVGTGTADALGAMLLGSAALSRQQPDPSLVALANDLAEAGFAAMPDHLPARNALALARLMAERYEDVRSLYTARFAASLDVKANAIGQAIRACAEAQLGDVAQAARLVAAAERVDPANLLVRISRALVQRAQLQDG